VIFFIVLAHTIETETKKIIKLKTVLEAYDDFFSINIKNYLEFKKT
jgi:hypothetical protein